MRKLAGVCAFLALASLAACAVTVKEPATMPAPDLQQQALGSIPSGTVNGPAPATAPAQLAAPAPQAPLVREPGYRETGIAGWYGKEFQGKKTASGKVFDMEGLSAAHRTLPLGTEIRVTNLDNFKSIRVKVNDRGPFIKGRIIDLSKQMPRGPKTVVEAIDAGKEAAALGVLIDCVTETGRRLELLSRLIDVCDKKLADPATALKVSFIIHNLA